MARVSAGRRAALSVLEAVDRGRRLDRALDDGVRDLEGRDRRWVHELTYGATRLRGRLDHLLDHHLHRGLESVSPPVLRVLRAGAYQLLRMDGVPAYAAVSQSVEQAREAGGEGTARMVNGVLRSLQRRGEDEDLFPDPHAEPAAWLTAWGSHPRWLVDRWLRRWPPGSVRALVEHDNRVPTLTIRPLGVSPDEAAERLEEAGVDARPVGRGTGCLALEAGTDPATVLDAVPSLVQGPGAALVTAYADPRPGSEVADLCAAPGGKALALAGRAAYLLAADPSEERLGLLLENEARLRTGPAPMPDLGPLGVVRARAQDPPVRPVDLVLLDVPCTGTGTLQAHPDGRWRLDPEDVSNLAGLQRRILEGAREAVRPGGLLVYSTCTLEPEENEEQVLAFLGDNPDFHVDPGTGVPEDHLDDRGFLRVLPQDTGFDGAFAARLRREG